MPALRKAYIEITNRCNRRCSFCHSTRRPGHDMDLPLFERALVQLQGRTRLLHLHVLGEPLLHPLIDQVLDRCHVHGFRVNLLTNGTNLAARGPLLFDKPALLQLSVSLHSVSDNPDGSADTAYFDALDAFIRSIPPNSRFYVRLRLWNSEAAASAQRRTRIMHLIDQYWGPLPPPQPQGNSEELFTLSSRISLHTAPRFEWPDPANPDYGGHGTCRGLRNQIAILADGTVTPCCLDSEGVLSLGSLRESSLEDILMGPRAVRIRTGFQHRRIVEPLCRHCSYRQRFDPRAGTPA